MKNAYLFPFILLMLACTVTETERRKADALNKPMPDQTAKHVEILHSEQGIKRVKITAPVLIMKDNPEEQLSVFSEGVAITFFDKIGDKTADLTAKYGQEDSRNQERYVKDSVVINTVKGEHIVTDELYMNDRKDSIYNNGAFVKITTPTQLIQGYGLLADAAFNNVRINYIFDSQLIIDGDNENTDPIRPLSLTDRLEQNKQPEQQRPLELDPNQ